MLRKLPVLALTTLFVSLMAHAADTAPSRTNLTAAQIVDKNVAARGGLQAWRAVKSMVLEGKMGAGGNARPEVSGLPGGKRLASTPTDPRPKDEVVLPFKMEMQRPRKSRFELELGGKTAFQVYDGANGWKLRPYLNRLEVEPFTADELKASSMQADLDGYLVDYAAKGTTVELDGVDKVEDRDAYKLKLTLKTGEIIHLWVDAETFLDAKIDGQPRRLDGVMHSVEVYYRDYRKVSGLEIPFVMETKVLAAAAPGTKLRSDAPVRTEKITLEKVDVNPTLDASLFAKPTIGGAPRQK